LTNCVVAGPQAEVERRAHEIAARLDALSPKERMSLPLFGLPFSVKECYLLKGTASTVGLAGRAGVPSDEDAALVAQMISLGAVPFCKTNVPQIMYAWECANPIHGVTSHPQHRSFIPGGSSGGEAALIAAGGSVVGIGTDIGGSCRIPAHMSGCVGLKCTKGRVSVKGKGPPLVYGEGQQIIASCSGPLARTADDLAFVLERLCDPASQEEVRRNWDSFVLPSPWNRSAANGREDQQLKVGWYCHDGFMEASPACVRAVHKAVAALERAGVCCVRFCPPDVEEAFLIYSGLMSTGFPHIHDLLSQPGERVADSLRKGFVAWALPMWLKVLVAQLAGAPIMEKVLRMVRARSGAEYYELVAAKMRYGDKFAKAFTSDLDLLLTPVHVLPTSAHMTTKDFTPTCCYSALQNLLDYPAGVVPVTTLQPSDAAWDSPIRDKLLDPPIRHAYAQAIDANTPFPIGVQLVGRPYTEEVVTRGMRELESALRAPQSLP
jgi:Asp-tRNA(Asn)/Glu-tRNA(Gln) amidotransferase A subunit family amidase